MTATYSPDAGTGGSDRRHAVLALAALALIILISVAWWVAALWPLPAETPDWVVRARAACFGRTESGLPNSGGWILLLGTPPSMLAALGIMAGDALRAGIRLFLRGSGGRWVAAATAVVLVALAGAAAVRVAEAAGPRGEILLPSGGPAPVLTRLGTPAEPLGLVDQHGATIQIEQFRGRPLLVTFAYGKCETVCPLVVHSALAAREAAEGPRPALVVVTLDPWRDTPARLPHIAGMWKMPEDTHVVSGGVDAVEGVIDGWGFARARDLTTGEIAHPTLVYVVDADGRLAYVVNGYTEIIGEALRRL
jgi:cytochrome oxidase Cu insertion factor (SCO1/SenC/PrrC family)